ncbi:bifunctional DNA primase/polymerase [Yinghuangia seranimata]|uniref:bifunctional DNA primase/polymerase n=1 Tax=Yinghuangia seranimata TaxID=408067 RepID=UPI00248C9A7A|nr:bifunctional DNA primase/polymerase [Yinghuangia seranimata]MDI2130818.1 bifunctional DNA primase/polymerase [Yinghuangia seranimata]
MLVRRRSLGPGPGGAPLAAQLAAALFYATDRGWPVLPGAYLDHGRCSCRSPRCPEPGAHPGDEVAHTAASRSADVLRAWWSRRPYTVLLATGFEFDVLDAPAPAGYAALRELAHVGFASGPVVHLPSDRLLFLVRPGARDVYWYTIDHNDAAHLDVRHHGLGHVVPAPAGPRPGGPEPRWAVAPDPSDRRLPEAVDLLGTLVRSCQHAAARATHVREEVSG